MTRTYSLGEFARLMGVHPKTVQRWDRDGTLTAKRTPTGRRFYTDEDRRRVLGFPEAQKRLLPGVERGPEAGSQEPKASALFGRPAYCFATLIIETPRG